MLNGTPSREPLQNRGINSIRCLACAAVAAALLHAATSAVAQTASPQTADKPQTLVFIRHGEKPKEGLGLLTCQGLNRALMLPDWFIAHFPPPDDIFAPDPKVKTTELHGDGQRYDYVRPLLTIGPTAIRLGVPINTQLPFNDPGLLADTLLEPQYRHETIYLAWEHTNILEFAEVMLTRFDSQAEVPEWPNSDYETVFVFTIDWSEPGSMDFRVESQGLGPMSDICPRATGDQVSGSAPAGLPGGGNSAPQR
jgi:hypothetical protein